MALGQRHQGLRAFLQQTPSPAGAVPYGNNAKSGHYVQAGDATIYYELYGQGKPFVVLHGGVVGSTYEMAPFIDSLSRRYQVIAVSTRGHGKSEIGGGDQSYERKAQDVAAILQVVTKDSALVVGFSDGAYTGYFLAKANPEKVKKLIAIGAGEWKLGSKKAQFSRAMLFGIDSSFMQQQVALMPQPKRFDEWLGLLNTYYNSLQVGQQTLGAIQCPVLVMAGEKDQNDPLKMILSAYEMIPKAQLSIIPNAPHGVFQANFPAVWTSMLPFISQ